jgi:hypothetical protein
MNEKFAEIIKIAFLVILQDFCFIEKFITYSKSFF